MISKAKIKKTLVCYWSAENQCFVAESAMIPHVVSGVGSTDDEALKSFDVALDNVYDEIASDNVAGYKMGRPAKGYVAFNANIHPASKAKLLEIASKLEISQGEALDYLVFFHECKLLEQAHLPKHNELLESLNAISKNLDQGFDRIVRMIDPSSTETNTPSKRRNSPNRTKRA